MFFLKKINYRDFLIKVWVFIYIITFLWNIIHINTFIPNVLAIETVDDSAVPTPPANGANGAAAGVNGTGKFEDKPLSKDMQDMLAKAGANISMITQFLAVPALMVISYIGELLDNKFILDQDMQEMLNSIWRLMRDIVNIIFVLVLLFLAFINVVKEAGSTSGWEIKAMLPKIVVALVLVNFSWSACKLLLDVSNVATAAVMAIPQTVKNDNNLTTASTIFANCIWNTNKDLWKSNDVGVCTPQMKQFLEDAELVKSGVARKDITVRDLLKAVQNLDKLKFTVSNEPLKTNAIVQLMAFGVMDMSKLNLNMTGSSDLLDLTFDALLSVILMIVYFIVFIAMFVVLIARALAIWLIIAFSPLWALQFALGDKFSIMDKIDIKVMHEFFMPVLIAVPLVIGYLMILVGMTIADSGSTMFQTIPGGHALMWKIAAVVILWKGVFAAMNDSLAAGVVEKIKTGAEGVGSFALRSLRYAPIFPIKVGEWQESKPSSIADLANLSNVGREWERNMENRAYENAKAISPIKFDDSPERKLRNAKTDEEISRGVNEVMHHARSADWLNNGMKESIAMGLKEAGVITAWEVDSLVNLEGNAFDAKMDQIIKSPEGKRLFGAHADAKSLYTTAPGATPATGIAETGGATRLSGDAASVAVGGLLAGDVANKIQAVPAADNDQKVLDARVALYGSVKDVNPDTATISKVKAEMIAKAGAIPAGQDQAGLSQEMKQLADFIETNSTSLDELNSAVARASALSNENERIGAFKAIADAVREKKADALKAIAAAPEVPGA